MQSDQQHFPQTARLPLADQVGNGYIPRSFLGQNVDFQPLKVCPRNFIIFDRTDNHSQIMYNPSMALGFGYPSGPDTPVRNDMSNPGEVMKEDSADIDALLSFEEEEEEEEEEESEDEEEVSTARTHGNDIKDTADSCGRREGRKGKLTLSSSSHKSSKGKREKMRKMVDSLRGMVPGGNRMSTVGVLDEAVKYLKSLKVEVQKIGVGNLQ